MNNIAVRLPNWLGDICMALPLVRLIQEKCRADSHSSGNSNAATPRLMLFVQPQYVGLLEKLAIDAELVPLPAKSWRYFGYFGGWRWRQSDQQLGQQSAEQQSTEQQSGRRQTRTFDAQLLFTNAERGDLEAWLMGSKKRYGIARPHQRRPLLTHRYHPYEQLADAAGTFDEQTLHQTVLWANFLKYFQWIDVPDSVPDFAPVANPLTPKNCVGLICGSANAPEKRWRVDNWQRLIDALLPKFDQVTLLGSPDDVEICRKIQSAFADVPRLVNLAGQTGLAALVDTLRQHALIIGNDTGGLHLANLLGVPVIGLYGVTNPVRCRPIHAAPLRIIESPKGYGVGVMDDITVAMVVAQLPP